MTDPKKILQDKLQSRLKQPQQKDAQVTGDRRTPDSQKPLTNHPPAGDTTEPEASEFTRTLESLIVQHAEAAQPQVEVPAETVPVIESNDRKVPKQKVKKTTPPKTPLSPEARGRAWHLVCVYGVAVLIVILDFATKMVAENVLLTRLDNSITVTSWLNLRLVYNPGAAFSMLADSSWQRPFLVAVSAIVSLVLMVWLARVPRHKIVLSAGLVAILGGAVGNLIDRVRYGRVVDFIDLHYQQLHFPTFNLADSMITLGAVLLVIDMFVRDRHKEGDAIAADKSSSLDLHRRRQI